MQEEPQTRPARKNRITSRATHVGTKTDSFNLTRILEVLKGLSAPNHKPVLPLHEPVNFEVPALDPSPATSGPAPPPAAVTTDVSNTSAPTHAATNAEGTAAPVQNEPLAASQHQVDFAGHKVVQIDGQCRVIATMPIPEQDQLRYKRIESRLIDELAQCFRTEVCHPELFMMSEKPGVIEATILLTCWNQKSCGDARSREKLRRKLQKRVHKLQSLGQNQFKCKVSIDNIALAARTTTPASEVLWQQRDYQTLAGLPLFNTSNRMKLCNLGGLISIRGQIYGLTVAHPFDHKESTDSPSDGRGGPSGSSLAATDSDADGSDASSLSAWSPINEPAGFQTRIENQNIRVQADEKDLTAFGAVHTLSDDMSGSSRPARDWAVIATGQSVPRLPNQYHLEGLRDPVQVETTARIPPFNTKVHIMHIDGVASEAIIGQTDVPLLLRGQKFLVTQVLVDRSLAPGFSGSWVVMQNSLIGVLIAGRAAFPMLYMVPIEGIFNEISVALGPCTIALPTIESQPEVAPSALTFNANDQQAELPASWMPSSSTPGTAESRAAEPSASPHAPIFRHFEAYFDSLATPEPAPIARQVPSASTAGPSEVVGDTPAPEVDNLRREGQSSGQWVTRLTQSPISPPVPRQSELGESLAITSAHPESYEPKPLSEKENRSTPADDQPGDWPTELREAEKQLRRIKIRKYLLRVLMLLPSLVIFLLPLGLGLGFGLTRHESGLSAGEIAAIVLGGINGGLLLISWSYSLALWVFRKKRDVP